MIKFFRRIRQKLLTSNQAGKYIFYALGEILLVVIGILIAVSLNNSNQARKENKRSKAYLERLNEDLQIMITDSESSIEYSERLLNNAITSKIVIETGAMTIEQKAEFHYYLPRFHQYPLSLQDAKSYREMLSSGELGLIKNRWIRDKLQEVSEGRDFLLEVGHAFHRQALNENEFISPHVKYDIMNPGTDSSQMIPSYNLELMSQDSHLINMISKQSTLWSEVVRVHKRYLNMIVVLKDSVQKEISLNQLND